MKTFFSIILSFICLSLHSCKEDKTGIDALPAATQEGKHTFGCLIDGKVFIKKKHGHYLSLSATNQVVNGQRRLSIFAPGVVDNVENVIYLKTRGLDLEVGRTYNLGPYTEGDRQIAYGIYSKQITDVEADEFSTTIGEMKITRLDNKIISGTFWFDAVNDKAEKIEFREGRFDISF
jgi:hypothetical protein